VRRKLPLRVEKPMHMEDIGILRLHRFVCRRANIAAYAFYFQRRAMRRNFPNSATGIEETKK
jgi:hypothetical protein